MCIRDSISIDSEVTNNKGKIVEVIVVENKTVNRPNVKDDNIMGAESGGETNQFNRNKVDQVAGNEVSNDMVIFMLKEIHQSLVKQNAMLDGMINDMKERNENGKLETDKLKENTEVESKQVSVCGLSLIHI